MVQEEISFKRYFLSRALEALLFSPAEPLCKFGRGHYEENLCEVILNLDQYFRRCRLKKFLIWGSGGPFVWQSGTKCAIVLEGHYEEHFYEIILNMDQWFRRNVVYRDFLSRALT